MERGMGKKALKIFSTLLSTQFLFNAYAYARDYSKDKFVYSAKGFLFCNTEAKIEKYYLRLAENKKINGIDVSKWQ